MNDRLVKKSRIKRFYNLRIEMFTKPMVRRSAMSRNWGMCLLGAALLCGGCAANSAGLDLRAKASSASGAPAIAVSPAPGLLLTWSLPPTTCSGCRDCAPQPHDNLALASATAPPPPRNRPDPLTKACFTATNSLLCPVSQHPARSYKVPPGSQSWDPAEVGADAKLLYSAQVPGCFFAILCGPGDSGSGGGRAPEARKSCRSRAFLTESTSLSTGAGVVGRPSLSSTTGRRILTP